MAENEANKAYELGKRYDKVYKGCSQSAISAIQDAFGIRNDDIFKAATAFAGGGCGTIDGSCGAYLGGIMILGFLAGRNRNEFDDFAKIAPDSLTFMVGRKFRKKFIHEYGSII